MTKNILFYVFLFCLSVFHLYMVTFVAPNLPKKHVAFLLNEPNSYISLSYKDIDSLHLKVKLLCNLIYRETISLDHERKDLLKKSYFSAS